MSERTLADIEADMIQARDNSAAWSRKSDEYMVELMTKRTDGFDAEIVARARELGINPDNFGSENLLQEAIEIKENEESE